MTTITPMKFVGLISGGKDSIFNCLQLVKAGHELVCLANLYPPTGGELDCYMYQSVGSEMIELVAEALQKPLFRRPITGTPKRLEMEYDGKNCEGDEVEDLFELLKEVKAAHPDVVGVSSGAINSTYQKNRVENLCERLDMVSLALLWEVDQKELLNSMIEGGMNSILIKVASYGLKKEYLGRTLTEMKPQLYKLADEYGGHVCGEGGEFES
jgi:diphthine-ammonia ligase